MSDIKQMYVLEKESIRNNSPITFTCNDCKASFNLSWGEDPTTSGGGCLGCGSSNWAVRDCYGEVSY